MKIKKFNLFITSNDVTDFGKSFSISKSLIYLFIFSFIIILFFFLNGVYSFFFISEIEKAQTSSVMANYTLVDSLLFSNDPVQSKGKSDFETSFITNNFNPTHIGIDINGKLGTKIYSPMKGKVVYEGYNKKLGNIIIISHDNGYITKYMHNKKNFVSVGQKISVNTPIAEMGNSGSLIKSEGIHVHFELWKDGTAINPLPFIKNLKLVDSNTLVSKNNVGANYENR